MAYSHRKAGQPGRITRLMSCTPEDLARLPVANLKIMDTHIAPSYTKHPRLDDAYHPYNKPSSIADWMAKTEIEEEFILVLDDDMILRRPFIPEAREHACCHLLQWLLAPAAAAARGWVGELTPRRGAMAGAERSRHPPQVHRAREPQGTVCAPSQPDHAARRGRRAAHGTDLARAHHHAQRGLL